MSVVFPGSPPRVRSRLWFMVGRSSWRGITSACAEQTAVSRSTPCVDWDHLRVCGADGGLQTAFHQIQGSPPRVRSRLTMAVISLRFMGITSACAEQTCTSACATAPARDHLRVCGADLLIENGMPVYQGSPPRVRSRQHLSEFLGVGEGITSACAEQTKACPALSAAFRDHLRVCGADHQSTLSTCEYQGSPPRVRSRRQDESLGCWRCGITSACAEQTSPPPQGSG